MDTLYGKKETEGGTREGLPEGGEAIDGEREDNDDAKIAEDETAGFVSKPLPCPCPLSPYPP